MAHPRPRAGTCTELAAVRRRLDELVAARLQPGWSVENEQAYRVLIARERAFLDGIAARRRVATLRPCH